MKSTFITTSLLILFLCVSCHKQENALPFSAGKELVVDAELVRSSEWLTRSTIGHSSEPILDYGTSIESSDGAYLITATRQPWDFGIDTAAIISSPLTRGLPVILSGSISDMRVNIFQTGSADWSPSSPLTASITATRLTTGFVTSPTYKWSPDLTAKTSLFAYTPIATPTNGITEVHPTQLNYSVPTAVTAQPDLCVATPKMNIINNDGKQQVQTFGMEHQLTAIGFSMLGFDLKISKITVTGVYTTGTLTMHSDGTRSWVTSGDQSGTREVGLTGSSFSHIHSDPYADITSTDGYLMMIPQALSPSASVTIEYTSTDGEISSTSGSLTVPLRDIFTEWLAGTRVTYQIRLKTAPAVTSGELAMPYSAWTSTTAPLSLVTDATDKLTFSWDASSDWLRVYKGSPSSGSAPGGLGSSGWSHTGPAGNIYFVANSENLSLTSPRRATVTVSGTRSGKKTFDVVQAMAPPPPPANSYIPTAVLEAAGWPADKLPATGLQVAMRGDKQMPESGTAGTDPRKKWKTEDTATAGTSSGELGAGKGNTAAMSGAEHPAAQYCRDMGPEWYLPSLKELKLIYDNNASLGADYSFATSYYWSSTENSSNSSFAWAVNFNIGTTGTTSRITAFNVRCVREI